MTERKRIVIEEEELTETPAEPTAPDGLPPLPPISSGSPRPIGVPRTAAAPATGSSILNNPRSSMLIAAAIGIFLGWGIVEISGVGEMEAASDQAIRATTGLWTALVGTIFGGVFLGFDRAVSGAWEEAAKRAARAAVPLFIASFISGYLAQVFYVWILEASDSLDPGGLDFYFARMLAWAIFGGGIGAVIGLVDRSQQKAINGGLGGLAGGAVGGLIFHFVTLEMGFGDVTSRLIGLMAVGLLIALAIRKIETVRRDAWLSVVAGGMTGKEFIIYHEVTRIGASPDCEIFLLKDPTVEKEHARILDQGGRRVLTASAPVSINRAPVRRQELRSGDQIQIGNTLVSYLERAAAPSN